MRITERVISAKKCVRDKMRKIRRTYTLIRELSSIDGDNINRKFLDRVMFSVETLPPLGKEYWWLLFFGRDGRQMMVLVYRKFGRTMVFNGQNVVFWKTEHGAFRAVTTSWICDGKELHDLGVTNPVIVSSNRVKALVSRISDQKLIFKGKFPEYELEIGDLVHLKMTEGNSSENKCAYGVYLPPFGAGWIDIFTNAEGTVMGKEFVGTAHLQKVVGVMPYGSFHWARVVFQNNSIFSFFCLKTGEKSTRYFHISMNFYDHHARKYIRFRKPRLKISEKKERITTWNIEGRDEENELRIVLVSYAEKKFTMHGGGSQTYIEYAVTPAEFMLKTKDKTITLKDLGEGIGSFEDAYGSPGF
ncbi:hypothetical protein [Methanoregula sp.]|uniref:hypothetical protein n=1 Tax=Methanoregula sp. TaxID=2052170 RepID=UPI0026107CC1|nr:hypothetical protein [Methanoregula sp.]MDD5143709.1 hypothetical protein [Methanoregula sp.]